MNNTKESFKDKWDNNPDLVFGETLREESDFFKWNLLRNGFADAGSLRKYLLGKKRILDAGCGNGRYTALLREYSNPQTTQIVGIDLVAHGIASKNLNKYSNIEVYQKDLLSDLKNLGSFDFIYCQEVLHHTNDPKKAFLNLVEILGEKGEIAIYVYKKKAPGREYIDDYIRNKISGMSYDDAYKVCSQITELGKVLSELNIEISVPRVDVLEIPAGKYDIQRFIYHFFMKCYWNSDISPRENIVINYDWYHPQNCSKHTIEEIREWFKEAKLLITHEYSDFYGITMHGKK